MMNEKLKSLSMQILQTCKMKKVDPYSIFRILTAKKSRYSINTADFNLEHLVPYDDLKDFIIKVNPYFDFSCQEKLDYYRNFYIISHEIFNCCIKLIEESETPAYYKLRDLNKNKFLTFFELDDSHTTDRLSHAKYNTMDDARKHVAPYLNLYNYLKIDKEIEIQIFNSQDQVLQKIKL